MSDTIDEDLARAGRHPEQCSIVSGRTNFVCGSGSRRGLGPDHLCGRTSFAGSILTTRGSSHEPDNAGECTVGAPQGGLRKAGEVEIGRDVYLYLSRTLSWDISLASSTAALYMNETTGTAG